MTAVIAFRRGVLYRAARAALHCVGDDETAKHYDRIVFAVDDHLEGQVQIWATAGTHGCLIRPAPVPGRLVLIPEEHRGTVVFRAGELRKVLPCWKPRNAAECDGLIWLHRAPEDGFRYPQHVVKHTTIKHATRSGWKIGLSCTGSYESGDVYAVKNDPAFPPLDRVLANAEADRGDALEDLKGYVRVHHAMTSVFSEFFGKDASTEYRGRSPGRSRPAVFSAHDSTGEVIVLGMMGC